MRVKYKCNHGFLNISFYPEANEGVDYTGKVKMGRHSCKVLVPVDWTLESCHPDVLALAIILMIYPFTKSRIELPIGVSQAFHDQFKISTQKEILPIDKGLQPRKAPKNSVPGLAYSGGVDSTAVLTLLPHNACCIFLDRIQSDNERLYNKEAAYYACESLRKLGRQVYMMKSNFEYIRQPKGFAVEMSTTIPALLLSDYIGLDSIALGITLEDSTFLEFTRFFAERLNFTKWESVFELVDMPLNQATRGISEIGNYKIAMNSPYGKFAQSCMRGRIQKPCMNCYKVRH